MSAQHAQPRSRQQARTGADAIRTAGARRAQASSTTASRDERSSSGLRLAVLPRLWLRGGRAPELPLEPLDAAPDEEVRCGGGVGSPYHSCRSGVSLSACAGSIVPLFQFLKHAIVPPLVYHPLAEGRQCCAFFVVLSALHLRTMGIGTSKSKTRSPHKTPAPTQHMAWLAMQQLTALAVLLLAGSSASSVAQIRADAPAATTAQIRAFADIQAAVHSAPVSVVLTRDAETSKTIAGVSPRGVATAYNGSEGMPAGLYSVRVLAVPGGAVLFDSAAAGRKPASLFASAATARYTVWLKAVALEGGGSTWTYAATADGTDLQPREYLNTASVRYINFADPEFGSASPIYTWKRSAACERCNATLPAASATLPPGEPSAYSTIGANHAHELSFSWCDLRSDTDCVDEQALALTGSLGLANGSYWFGERAQYTVVVMGGSDTAPLRHVVLLDREGWTEHGLYTTPIYTTGGAILGAVLLRWVVLALWDRALRSREGDSVRGIGVQEPLLKERPSPRQVAKVAPLVLSPNRDSWRSIADPLNSPVRVRSIDALRGLCLCMVVMLNPREGVSGGGYWFLKQSAWDGLTLADLGEPAFVFLSGMSLAHSLNTLLAQNVARDRLAYKLVRRNAIVLGVGAFLNNQANYREGRYPGVFQLIGVANLIVGLVVLFVPKIPSLYTLPTPPYVSPKVASDVESGERSDEERRRAGSILFSPRRDANGRGALSQSQRSASESDAAVPPAEAPAEAPTSPMTPRTRRALSWADIDEGKSLIHVKRFDARTDSITTPKPLTADRPKPPPPTPMPLMMQGSRAVPEPPTGAQWRGYRLARFLEATPDVSPYLAEWAVLLLLTAARLVVVYRLQVPGCPVGYVGAGGVIGDFGNFAVSFAGCAGATTCCTGGFAGHADVVVFGAKHLRSQGSVWNPAALAFIGDKPSSRPTRSDDTAVAMYGVGAHDPDGVLGIVSAVLVCYLGFQAGRTLIQYPGQRRAVLLRWLIWALALGVLGGLISTGMPVNSRLWSLSFVLISSGIIFAGMAATHALVVELRWSGEPFGPVGINALAVAAGSRVLSPYAPFSWHIYSGDYSHGYMLAQGAVGAFIWVCIAHGWRATNTSLVVH